MAQSNLDEGRLAAPRPARWHTICALDELESPGAKGFVIPDDWPVHAFVVRKGERVYAYVNVCPHTGRSLHWKPDAFLTKDRNLIICSAHGAIFEIETGICLAGPCPGARLRALPVRVSGGLVDVATTEPAAKPRRDYSSETSR